MKQKIGNDNIFLDQPSGELTFGKIFKILKCSLLRMLVYLLVACIVASSVALILTVSDTKEHSLSTIIEYNYPGIDSGLDPANEPLSVDRIKNASVLNSAIKMSELDKVKDMNATNLAPNIKITGIIPQDIYVKIEDIKNNSKPDANINELLNSIKYFPKRYTIKFQNYTKFDITENQAHLLLENILKAYQVEWLRTYSPAPSVPTTIFDQILADEFPYEYVDYPALLMRHLDQLVEFISMYKDTKHVAQLETPLSDGTTKEQRLSYSSILTEIDILKAGITSYSSYVSVNKVYKNPDIFKSALENDVEVYTKLNEKLNDDKKDIMDQIDAIKPSQDIIDKPNGQTQTIEKYPASYEILQQRLLEKNIEISKCRELLTVAKGKLDNFNSVRPDGDIALAQTMLKDISTEFKNLVKKTDAFVANYRENAILTDEIIMATPISRSNASTVSNKIILVIFMLGAVVAIIAAISVTVTKQKVFAFNKKKADAKAAAESEKNEDVVADKDAADEICAEDKED